jgi:hypothetical protein
MTLKNAATLAMIGTLLLSLLVMVEFVNTISGVMGDVIPAIALVKCVVYLFASVAATVFFWVFGKAQSR